MSEIPFVAKPELDFIFQLQDRIAELEAQNGELLAALKGIMQMIKDEILVRNTSHDHEPSWAIKQIPLVQALQKASAAIAKAPEEL